MSARGESGPGGARLSICPHCWEVNVWSIRLCGRCGADMALALQESGGLRRTAPVQSPVPVRGRERLSPLQRMLILLFVCVLFVTQILSALYTSAWRVMPRPGEPPVVPAGAAGLD